MAFTAFFDVAWQPGQGAFSAPSSSLRAASRSAVTVETVFPSIPTGSRLLSAFLAEFEALPDIADGMAEARADVARERVAASGEETLRDLRLAAGLSQNQFAQAMNTSQSRVSRLECRAEKPAEDVIRLMASILKVDFNRLMGALARVD